MRHMTCAVLPKTILDYLNQPLPGGYDADIAEIAKKHFALESSANKSALQKSVYFSACIGSTFIGLAIYSHFKEHHKAVITTLSVIGMAGLIFTWYLHGRTHAYACAMCAHAQNGEDQMAVRYLFQGVSNALLVDGQPLLNYAAKGKCRITAGVLMLLLSDQERADMGGEALSYCLDDAAFCDYLIDLGASLNHAAGHYLLANACQKKDEKRIKNLIEHGAPTQGFDQAPIEYALEGDDNVDTQRFLKAFGLSIKALKECQDVQSMMRIFNEKKIAITQPYAEKLLSELFK